MKFGFKMPSLKRKIAARLSLKRVLRHKLGLKAPSGFGIITDPKKAIYNKIYRKTTFGIEDLNHGSKRKNEKSEPITKTNLYENIPTSAVLDEHFNLSMQIPELYKRREEPGILGKVIDICQQQIRLAPQAAVALQKEFPGALPRHVGYDQLITILQKQGNIESALSLSTQARQEGWAGDWDKKIERLNKVQQKNNS